jgi:signal transduction histidine kinase
MPPRPDPTHGFQLPDETDRLADLGRIAGALIHELKNPLGTMLLNAEMLSAQDLALLPEPARSRATKRLARIQGAGETLQHTIAAFLAFARPGRLDADAVDCNRLLATLLDEHAEADAQAKVAVAFHPDEALALVPGDRIHLRSIFANILVNARQALDQREEDRRLVVVTRAAPGSTRIVIANNGPPLPERVASRLFQPFVSGREGGTGLGLAIVRRLVELHGGTIAVSSDRDQGVSFTIELPTTLPSARPRPALGFEPPPPAPRRRRRTPRP